MIKTRDSKGRIRQEPFWLRINMGSVDECWTYMSGNQVRYPHTQWEGKTKRVNRIVFFLTEGYWPKICRHTCDNYLCVSPFHLLDGSVSDNAIDSVKRGRHPFAKLTVEDIPGIRERIENKESWDSIATRYGVSRRTIYAIANKQHWGWVE